MRAGYTPFVGGGRGEQPFRLADYPGGGGLRRGGRRR